jgi:hypothetical protein
VRKTRDLRYQLASGTRFLVVRAGGDHLANLLIADLAVVLVAVLPNLLDETLVVLGAEVNVLVGLVNAVECAHLSPP